METPLTGVRVVSAAEMYPGPYATLLLADLGADVILVERRGEGDPTRRFPGHFEGLNRNKRSVAIDLKSARGREAFLRLAKTADVVMEGFRPGVMERLGLSATVLRDLCPDLVYVSISGFGQDGPLRARAGHDLSIQGAAGLVQPPSRGEQPVLPTLPLADLSSGMFATIGVLAALLARGVTGRGSHVDVSMLDGLVSWMSTEIASQLNGLAPSPHPPEEPGYGVFGTADGASLTLSIAGEDHLWEALCEAVGLDDVMSLGEAERVAQAGSLRARLREAMGARTAGWLEERLGARGVPFGPVNSPAEVAADPQVVARGLIVGIEGSGGGTGRRYVRQPLQFDGRGSTVTCPAPRVGEHTRSILAEIGYGRDEVDAMLADGIVDQH